MIRFLTVLCALMLAIPASAHQQKVAISTVELNPRTQLVEIVHRIPLHDAEHALRRQGINAPDIVGDTDSRRAFARYAADRFSIWVDDVEVSLTLLGSEIEGGHLLVYQEGSSIGVGTELQVQSQVLTDVWTRQVNRVNVGSGTNPQTLIFRAGDPPQSATLR